jgi:guanylate cyclase
MGDMTSKPESPEGPPQAWLNRHESVRKFAAWFGMTWDPDDEVEHRREMLMAVAIAISLACMIWVPIYLAFGEVLAASIPGGYAVVTIISMRIYALYPNFPVWRSFQFASFMFLPTALMLSLGGFVEGSVAIMWSMLAPLGALTWGTRCEAFRWFIAFIGILVGAGLLESRVNSPSNLSEGFQTFFFIGNIGVVSGIAFWLLRSHVDQQRRTVDLLDVEREKSESLLLNVLPTEVARRLKSGTETIADHYPSASILFADVVGFTVMSSVGGPEKMVNVLNTIFSHFDRLAEEFGVEKIRTIGDGYMAVCGAPVAHGDHAQRIAGMALRMLAYEMPEVDGQRCQVRIGINSGEVIGGVIGTTKFHYDVWGDAVNVAARMESQGVPERIQIGASTYGLIEDEFACAFRGEQEIKGKGAMKTWFLESRKISS